jgi:ubiquinone/menaquinone biosynthesis C-methylase UbiE
MRKRQNFFNQLAQNWDKAYNNSELHCFLEQFVPAFGLLAGQHIQDVGTGTGILIPFLHKVVGSNGHITAIDYAQNMVDICKTKYSHLSNVSIMVANAERLQFPDNSFDAVICFGVFPHLDNKKVALNQFHRVLKSKGNLIIGHALSRSEVRRHHQNAPEVANDVLPTEKEMQKLLRNAGFTGIQIVDEQGRYLCTSRKL